MHAHDSFLTQPGHMDKLHNVSGLQYNIINFVARRNIDKRWCKVLLLFLSKKKLFLFVWGLKGKILGRDTFITN